MSPFPQQRVRLLWHPNKSCHLVFGDTCTARYGMLVCIYYAQFGSNGKMGDAKTGRCAALICQHKWTDESLYYSLQDMHHGIACGPNLQLQ